MNAEDILNNTDPRELRNILRRLKLKNEAYSRPVPNIVINQAPQQFPPSSTTVDSGLDWFNVKKYGAIGNGTADDTAAINTAISALTNAGKGVLYFPAGQYLTSGGFTLSVPFIVLGTGMANLNGDGAASEIRCNSATATVFTITAVKGKFLDIAFKNVAGSTPSAGVAISVAGSSTQQRVDYDAVSVYGFYVDIDVQVGQEWTMHNCSLNAPVKYALKIQNTESAEAGDWLISESHFDADLYDADAAIRIESSGGGKIVGCKINSSDYTNSFEQGIDVDISAGGVTALVHDTSAGPIYSTNADASSPNWLQMIGGLTSGQYAGITRAFVTPSGAVYVARINANTDHSGFIARAPSLGSAFTVIMDGGNPLGYAYGVWGLGFNPTVPDYVCALIGTAGDRKLYAGSGGTLSAGGTTDAGIGSVGTSITFGDGKWVATKYDAYVVIAENGLSVSSFGSISTGPAGSHKRAGTSGTTFHNRNSVTGMVVTEDNFSSHTLITDSKMNSANFMGSFDCDDTGTSIMAQYDTGAKGKSSDGGSTWSDLSALAAIGSPNGWNFGYIDGSGSASRWMAAGASFIKMSSDFGATWNARNGDIGSIVATPAIDLVHIVRSRIGGTGRLQISNTSIENIRGHGIEIISAPGHDILINDILFGLSYGTGNDVGNAINISGECSAVVIADCILRGGSTPTAIDLANCDQVMISGNINVTFSSLYTLTSCTNVVIDQPTTAVTAETNYGLSPSVGTTTSGFALGDHTHGSPSLSTATPQDVGSSGAAGSGSTPSKNDHVHKGVHSVNGLFGDVTILIGGQVTDMARWVSGGGTTFDLPDIAESLLLASDNGSIVDPTIYSLSGDRTQLIFDSSITAGHIVTADYIVAQV